MSTNYGAGQFFQICQKNILTSGKNSTFNSSGFSYFKGTKISNQAFEVLSSLLGRFHVGSLGHLLTHFQTLSILFHIFCKARFSLALSLSLFLPSTHTYTLSHMHTLAHAHTHCGRTVLHKRVPKIYFFTPNRCLMTGLG